MDPRRFYGGIHTILKDFPDSSADEDLSDDEQLTNRRRKVLPPLCIPESEESDSVSDDNIPLSHLASSTIPEGLNYKLFFDNWYTSLPLLTYLNKKGILPIGTIKANRIPGYKVPVEKDLKKMPPENYCYSKNDHNYNTIYSLLYRQQIVTYSNYVAANHHLSSHALLGYYRIQIRSKKFYHRIFFHMIDMMTVNAWLLYRRTLADSDPYLPLADFKCAVAEGLSQTNKPSTSGKRGRPSYELENAIEAKKLRGPIAIMPSRDVRLDQIDHMPVWTTRQRCKVPECNGRSHVECQKCKNMDFAAWILCYTDKRYK
ncbi:hypothetical protein SFRURICE_019765 [Spodoptera frugiperda]|nr:hypothetical protein SFRURICE_019765 [Spodoptera frugiperda]